jgi:HSF-type DNA-binding
MVDVVIGFRRLRDMLKENEGTISFVEGDKDTEVLGRIVVHDRIEVEATVLPRYFNHSSFASLRRQLNYFSFVRLGKGRQRESAYVNEGVFVLDDVLNLQRRSGPGAASDVQAALAIVKEQVRAELEASAAKQNKKSDPPEKASRKRHRPQDLKRPKRRRTSKTKKVDAILDKPESARFSEGHVVSEDETSSVETASVAQDHTLVMEGRVERDVLLGVEAMLALRMLQ